MPTSIRPFSTIHPPSTSVQVNPERITMRMSGTKALEYLIAFWLTSRYS